MRLVHFVYPQLLLAWLLLLPVLGFSIRARRKYSKSFSRRYTGLALVAFAFCILGLSRPQLGHVSTSAEAHRSQVVLVVDVSKSMLAKDITPSRLDFAVAFASQLLQRLGTAKVALFPFALDGYMQVPFTSDTAAIVDMLASLNPNDTTNQGTDLSRVLETLYRQLNKLEQNSRNSGSEWLPTQVILLSDGESHYPIRDEISDLFNKSRIPIFSVGIGSDQGAQIPAERGVNMGDYIRDGRGANVITKLHPETLRRISQRSGGDYYAAKFEEIEKLAKRIEQSMQFGRLSTSFQVEQEYFPQCFLLAFLLFCLEFSLGRWEYAIRSFIFLSLLIPMFPNRTYAADTSANDNTGLDDETRAVKLYNQGVEQLKSNGLMKAAEFFQESALLTANPILKKRALYNLGDVMVKQSDPQQGLDAFQQAFDITTRDKKFDAEINQKTSENMALAYQILQKIKKQPSEGGEGKSESESDQGKPGQGADDQKGPKKFRSQNFSDQEKKKIFDLVASEEQDSLQRIQAQRNQGQNKNTTDKPW